MGMLKKRVKVSNSRQPELSFEEEFWVDTGALYSFVPEDCLERIAVEPSATRNVVLWQDDTLMRKVVSAFTAVEHGALRKRLRNYARRRGLKRRDVAKAIAKVRGRS